MWWAHKNTQREDTVVHYRLFIVSTSKFANMLSHQRNVAGDQGCSRHAGAASGGLVQLMWQMASFIRSTWRYIYWRITHPLHKWLINRLGSTIRSKIWFYSGTVRGRDQVQEQEHTSAVSRCSWELRPKPWSQNVSLRCQSTSDVYVSLLILVLDFFLVVEMRFKSCSWLLTLSLTLRRSSAALQQNVSSPPC